MTFPPITELLLQSEHITLEFKRIIDAPVRIAKTLAAFANTRGGWLIIGVDDDHTIRGIESEKDEIQKLEAACDFFVRPDLLLKYQAITYQERLLLMIWVPESEEKPHEARNKDGVWQVYVRAKDKSVPATKQMGKWLQQTGEISSEILQQHTVKRLLEFLQKNERITAKRYAQLVNISEYRANKLLQQLTREGILLLLEKQRPKSYVLKK
ncbi:MAG: putative DNA binding domain-containing protein [Siphonobacter sp.]